MSVLTCPEVEELIDLHAAGACDAAAAAAVRAHLAACPDCARAHREAERLQGLLDVHYQAPAALRRLHERLDTEAAPRRLGARGFPRAQRIAALAALVLLTLGLTWLMGPAGSGGLPRGPANLPERAGTASVPGGDSVVAWASPDARWSESAGARGREVDLKAGEVWLRVAPGAGGVKVRTPAGEASAEAADGFVAVKPAGGPGQPANLRVTVRAGSVRLANARGRAEALPGDAVTAWADEAPRLQVEALALRFARHYDSMPIEVTGHIPTRPLPVDLAKVANYPSVAKAFALDGSATERLRTDGLVVLPGREDHDMLAAYRRLRARGVPLVITADTLLHMTRAHLDETLRSIEERVLIPDLETVLETLLRGPHITAFGPVADREAARKQVMGYLAVGLRALRPDAPLPRDVDAEDVEEALKALRTGAGPVRLRLLGRTVDFRSSRPQGHYARSERLKRYHAALTWFSRVPLSLEGGPGLPVSADEARRQALTASLLSYALWRAERPERGKVVKRLWERIYAVSAFFTGLIDDLGPDAYIEAIARAGPRSRYGTGLHMHLHEPDALQVLKEELAKMLPAADLGAKPEPATPAGLLKRLGGRLDFRLFGRPFAPDNDVLERLVYPHVGPPTRTGQFTYGKLPDGRGIRALPRGLDLMTVLGSERARARLRELGDDAYAAGGGAPSYPDALAALRRRFARFDEVDWNRNLAWSWLYALRPLLAERGAGYPPFMRGRAYRTKALTTALAAWAQRRQDTALYVPPGGLQEMKAARAPAVAPGAEEPGEVYLEPVPDLYARLLALTRMARNGLDSLGVLDRPARLRLGELEEQLLQVAAVAEKELANEALSAADRTFLARLPERLDGLAPAADTRSRVIVYRDAHTGQVLQEATGPLGTGLFVYQRADGRLLLGAGPVLSYSESKQPQMQP